MNYLQIKQNIISLGFAEESDYEEYEELGYTYDAINRAINQVGMDYPYVEKYEFEIDDEDEGFLYLDMTEREGFLDFADTPVVFEQSGKEMFTKFSDYQIEMGHTIVINADENKGSFRVYYNREYTLIDSETPDDFVPELPLKAHALIPLLAAHYLWMDDDPTKAAQYYNMYETKSAVIAQQSNQPRIRVVPDRRWGDL